MLQNEAEKHVLIEIHRHVANSKTSLFLFCNSKFPKGFKLAFLEFVYIYESHELMIDSSAK